MLFVGVVIVLVVFVVAVVVLVLVVVVVVFASSCLLISEMIYIICPLNVSNSFQMRVYYSPPLFFLLETLHL